MLLRILSASVLIPVVLAGVYFARPWPFLVALGIIGTLCLREYFGLLSGMGIHPLRHFGYPAFWILLIGLRGTWIPGHALLAGLIIGLFLAAMWRRGPLRERAFSLMAGLLGLAYPGLFLYSAVSVRFDFGDKAGMQWFIVVLAVTWAGDSAAMFTGRKLGRTPFAAQISPRKTNEGAIGGFLGGIAAALLLQQVLFKELPLAHVLAVASVAGIFGQLGDLGESMLKRAAVVKDSSHLIPGHGGVLDRIDSLLFAFPVTWLYLLVFHRG